MEFLINIHVNAFLFMRKTNFWARLVCCLTIEKKDLEICLNVAKLYISRLVSPYLCLEQARSKKTIVFCVIFHQSFVFVVIRRLNCCLIRVHFEPHFAYKSIAHKKRVNNKQHGNVIRQEHNIKK